MELIEPTTRQLDYFCSEKIKIFMTIHITDIPNESFNHYKHVLHVDNEFALIEINKGDFYKLNP